ncbi:cytochrome [Streptomyces fodineus]|uniref:Cytochrome n=1 Tax=Streptomyces fodineus TaxID=1904616 RepID=A0A1D7Y9J9_9ACTN|nr:cytochrome P450 [Streptomyces fodineus]AOR32308.1 cytochrome [Streptomyces fodineus]
MSSPDSGVLAVNTVDLTDPAAFADRDPYPFWRQVREQHPVYWHEGTAGRPGFWVVSRYADVVAAYADADALGSQRGTVLDVLLEGDDSAGGRMLAVTDRPRHRELRAVLWRAFAPRHLERVAERVHRLTERLIDEVTGTGTFDFAAEVAERIPLTTICELLSVPEGDRADLLRYSKAAFTTGGPDDGGVDPVEARNEIVLYFMDLAETRRAAPGDDVVSMIATARVDGAPLSLEEVALNCYSLILGGDESSRISAVCAVRALAEHPGQWRALRTREADLDTAVEEMLRWATPGLHFARTARREVVIAGQRVRAGDIVTLWNISANNDETVFCSPRTFDLGRSPNKHVTFGHGPHFCLGAFLGRAELHALSAALVNRVAGIELRGTPTAIRSTFLHGDSSLPVSFRPR